MVTLEKSSTVHLRWMLLMRSINFTWMDLVYLVACGVSLVIYQCIESTWMFLKWNIEHNITFNSISIQLDNTTSVIMCVLDILENTNHIFLPVCCTLIRLLD